MPLIPIACAHERSSSPSFPSTRAAQAAGPPVFIDVAGQAGVNFTHTNGATGQFHYIEFGPAGCAFFDYDNDGYLDILLIQSGPCPSHGGAISQFEHPVSRFCALYHNNGDGTFTDVTSSSGLDKDLGYAQGVAVGDYDNDGYEDLFITSYPRNFLFHNRGTPAYSTPPAGGNDSPSSPRDPNAQRLFKSPPSFSGTEGGRARFEDVTHAMGLDQIHGTGYATSAAFGDYDNDGRLDLYICYYSPWRPEQDQPCFVGGERDYCAAESQPPQEHRLYHNEGSRFVDVSAAAGILKAKGRGLAVAFTDADEDGRQDIFVANDVTPNLLWHNNGDGTFTETAKRAGCAYSEEGALMAGMGIALADYDHSTHQSLFVSNFSGMPNTLYGSTGRGLFQDRSAVSALAVPHLKYLAFGCAFLDYDADGYPDLIVANGHVNVHADKRLDGSAYRERKQLFHNEGNGTFNEVTEAGKLGDLAVPMVSRGLAVGDFDNDGRIDALVNNQNGPAQLFHNELRNGNHWVGFKTIGVKSNRDGIHTRFTLTTGSMRQTAVVRTDGSYLSSVDRRIFFGLGKATNIDRVAIHWPSGIQETLQNLEPDHYYQLTEGRGITGRLPQRR